MKNYLYGLFLLFNVSAFAQTTAVKESDSLKNKVIKYHINKLTGGGREIVPKRMEVTISQENINTYSEIGKKVVEFNAVIQKVDWKFNATMTKGSAQYKGYIKRNNGDAKEITLLIEVDESGKLQMYDPTLPAERVMVMHVDHWTVIK